MKFSDDADGKLRRLTSGLSHELRNPIGAALLQLEVLERRVHLDDAAREPLRLARAELDRAMELVKHLLTYTRQTPIEPVATDVLPLLQHVVAIERPAAEKRGIEITLQGASATAMIDAPRLTQVLQNVLRNAVEASEDESTVRVSLETGRELLIRIADEGAQVPAEVQARMFEPFFTTKRQGVGLGLAIAKSIVEQHGGQIGFDSDARGSLVTIRIPIAK